MSALRKALDQILAAIQRMLFGLLCCPCQVCPPQPGGSRGDSGKPIVSPRCAEPKGYPRRSGRKYIERHGKGYRIRFWRRGRVIYLGCYNSLLAAVRDRNKALRAWDMEIPD